MKKLICILCVACLLGLSPLAQAQDSTHVKPPRPKVGLILSGGGAKGAAHIGVLKYIEEMGIPIDFIAGNSMGAVMGGFYALGDSTDEIIDIIESKPHPLALYIFSNNKKNVKKVTEKCRYGGGCINDVVLHLATPELPFGGCGASGMGAYHGKAGFDTFTHYTSIVDKKTWLDLPMRYQPYTKLNEKLIRMFLK